MASCLSRYRSKPSTGAETALHRTHVLLLGSMKPENDSNPMTATTEQISSLVGEPRAPSFCFRSRSAPTPSHTAMRFARSSRSRTRVSCRRPQLWSNNSNRGTRIGVRSWPEPVRLSDRVVTRLACTPEQQFRRSGQQRRVTVRRRRGRPVTLLRRPVVVWRIT